MTDADQNHETVAGILMEYLPWEILTANSGDALVDALANAITEAVAKERELNSEARRALADAAREIPMAGPVADRIRALKEQHRVDMQTERERAGKLVTAAKQLRHYHGGMADSLAPQESFLAAIKFDTALQAYEVPHE